MFAKITSKIYRLTDFVQIEIISTLKFPEMGGILGSKENGVVNFFYYDSTGKSTERNYIPDTITLNEIISDWYSQGINFVGFVHSHSAGKKFLSRPDVHYANNVKRCFSMSKILMVIYLPSENTFYQYIL